SLGNVYVTGSSFSSGTFSDYATAKYGPDGALLWIARYDGPGNNTDTPNALAIDNDGNVYVTGGSWGGQTTGFDVATVKYDLDGNQVWAARYNGPNSGEEGGQALAVDLAGNVYVTGYTTNSIGGFDYLTLEDDSS